MQIVPTNLSRIRRNVYNHGFSSPTEWADCINELASLSDAEIDECCCETWDRWPSLPLGVTAEQAAKDRELLAACR
jgi:hypothetical protein